MADSDSVRGELDSIASREVRDRLVELNYAVEQIRQRLGVQPPHHRLETLESSPKFEIPVVSDGDPLGAARIAKAYLKARRARDTLFPPQLFGEAAWDILLDLYVNKIEGRKVSVSSACLAAGTPPTTALRWVVKLQEVGLIKRVGDPLDRRIFYLYLEDDCAKRIAQWLMRAFPRAT
jgi:hypothetical protein